jgi:serine/threonine protein kinase
LLKCGKCLQALHRMQLVHRDIKPDNFLIRKMPDQTTRVVLSDFGLSTGPKTEQTPEGNCCGTTSYKAPEIVLNTQWETTGSEVHRKMLNST